jgi:hypothetical protein
MTVLMTVSIDSLMVVTSMFVMPVFVMLVFVMMRVLRIFVLVTTIALMLVRHRRNPQSALPSGTEIERRQHASLPTCFCINIRMARQVMSQIIQMHKRV